MQLSEYSGVFDFGGMLPRLAQTPKVSATFVAVHFELRALSIPLSRHNGFNGPATPPRLAFIPIGQLQVRRQFIINLHLPNIDPRCRG